MELDHEFTVPVPVDQAWPVLLDVERVAPCMPGATLDSIDGDEFTGRLRVRLGAMTITYRGSARFTGRDESSRTVTIEGTGKEARGTGTASATVQARLHDEGAQTRVTVHTTLNVTGRPAQFGRGILSEVGGKLVKRFADNLAEELARDETAGAVASATAATGTPAESGTGDAATTTGSDGAAAGATATEGAGVSGPAGGTRTPTATGNGTPTAPTLDAASSRTAPPADAKIPTGGGTGAPAESTGTAPAKAASGSAAERPDGELRTRPGAEPVDLLEVAGPSVAKRAVPVLTAFALLWALWRVFRRRSR